MTAGNKLFALVDYSNFYVSCEQVFLPALWNRPVVVLFNNDGCIIIRSNEVKALGILLHRSKMNSEHSDRLTK